MRPLARSYLQHGSRHGSTGSDPIPGISQIQFATLHKLGTQTIAGDNAIHYIDMQDGVSGIYETSNSSVFENASNAGLAGSPWGIKCLANGTYIVKQNSFVGVGTAGVKVTCYHTLTGGSGPSFYQPGRVAALIGDTWDGGAPGEVKLFFEEWTDITDINPPPLYVNPYVRVPSGSDVTVATQTMVIYLGPYAGAGAL